MPLASTKGFNEHAAAVAITQNAIRMASAAIRIANDKFKVAQL
ncbi:MAG: hypothetical protein PUP93_06125 [Rhizonema sp. NSF051]|nr:hypothetical protein [Rhizonema sp. NSF051]